MSVSNLIELDSVIWKTAQNLRQSQIPVVKMGMPVHLLQVNCSASTPLSGKLYC